MARLPNELIEQAPLDERLRELARRGEVQRYRKGTVIIHEGDQGQTIFILLAGRVRVFSAGEKDRELTFGIYGPGEYLGEISLDGGPRSASVETLEPTVCVVITRPTLQQFIADVPEFAFDLLTKVIRRARNATFNAKQLALNDVYGRLKHLLEDTLCTVREDGVRWVADRPTHQDMSHRMGCSREMVSRLMKDLENGGWVRAEGDALILLRPLPSRW
jgi:CRP/FNR family transcriptional regulator, cyclic AMP receptor protein